MLIKNNTINWFEKVEKFNYNWINELKTYINSEILKYTNILKEESILDKNCNLSDINYLYSCFEHNLEFEEIYAQYEILKYFYLHMIIKSLHYVIGEWQFTFEDKEMLKKLVELQTTNKCKPSKLKFKCINSSLNKHVLDLNVSRHKFHVYFEHENSCIANIHSEGYLMTFYSWFAILHDLVYGNIVTYFNKTISENSFFNFEFYYESSYDNAKFTVYHAELYDEYLKIFKKFLK